MIFFSPCFFLLVDSWLGSAAGAAVEEFADCTVALLESVEELFGEVEASVAAGAFAEAGCEASAVGCDDVAGAAALAGDCGKASGLPGVIVSTAAVLPTPTLDEPAAAEFGCRAIPSVSSPDSLAGVMVGSPLLAAID